MTFIPMATMSVLLVLLLQLISFTNVVSAAVTTSRLQVHVRCFMEGLLFCDRAECNGLKTNDWRYFFLVFP